MCSFISKTPPTDILLQHRPLAICVNYYSERVGDTMNDEANISMKLIVSKSKKVVC